MPTMAVPGKMRVSARSRTGWRSRRSIKDRVFPLCKHIPAVSIVDDHVEFLCELERGSMLPELVRQLEADESVRYVTASLEASDDANTAGVFSTKLALSKGVVAHVTVYFKVPGESGEENG